MVLLWIGIPLIIIFVMAAGYFYNRKRNAGEADEALSLGNEPAGDLIGPGQTPPAGEKAYEGLLWLKGKYEDDIEKAETRFYEMREEFRKLEKKYIDLRVHSISLEQLLHSADGLPVDTQGPMERSQTDRQDQEDPRDKSGFESHTDLDPANLVDSLGQTGFEGQADQPVDADTQRELSYLNDKLAAETLKVKDLETRLASSSRLLMKMYKELAGSLEASNTFYKNKAHENRVKGLVKEFDAVAASGKEERKISSWVESPSVEEDGQFE